MTEPGSKGRCFVVCPIGKDDSPERKHSDQVLKHIIAPATQECGYVAERSSDDHRPGMITSQIINSLVESPLVVADLSFHNPNVFYELAVRHAARKPVVIICDKKWGLPFDISNTRVIRFDFANLENPVAVLDSFADARQRLVEQIRSAQEANDEVDNPISSSIDLAALRAGSQPEQRDAMILERLEELSLDMHRLSSTVRRSDRERSREIRRREINSLTDDPEYRDLLHNLIGAGWNIDGTGVSASGVELLLRPVPHTSDFPGMETRSIRGRNEKEAIRESLAKIRGEVTVPTIRRGILDFQQDPEYIELARQLEALGWEVGRMSVMVQGVEVTVRPIAGGSLPAGTAERSAIGRDEVDAVRNVLNGIKAEKAVSGSSEIPE